MAVAIWTTLYFLLLFPESELSASTAEMFEVVGQFLKCLGLLSQVGWYYFLNCFEVVIDLSVVKFVFSTKICRRCCQALLPGAAARMYIEQVINADT